MNDIVEDELLSSSIIKDSEKLDFDYIPDELPHREDKLRMLARLFKPVLNNVPQNAVITGSVGTGKTVLAKRFCLSLIKTARKQGIFLDYVHINCRRRSTDSMVLLGILNHFDQGFPDRGFSVQEMLQVLNRQLTRRKSHLIVVLDEVDALLHKSGSDLIYNLTRFSDEYSKKKNLISLILISQKNIFSMLDISSLSTIKRSNHIHLDKYSRDELYDIIKQRVDLAFHRGVVNEDSINLIADIASEWGDARFAIELLWKAGLSADQQHSLEVTPEHVRAAKAETYSLITESKLRNLSRHHLLTLEAIAKRLYLDGTAYTNTGDAERMYMLICEEHNEKPRAHTMFWSYLKDIENAGFITLKKSGKGQLGTTQLISLPDIPAEILCDKIEEILPYIN